MGSFKEDVLTGLSQDLKTIPSRYFYDATGDALFQRIMKLDEYYLPRLEMRVISEQSRILAGLLEKESNRWKVIELGAGDGTKTVVLLGDLLKAGLDVTYSALDISENILVENSENISGELPGISLEPVAGNYFDTCHRAISEAEKNLVMFMGSNIGNYSKKAAGEFFSWMASGMNSRDLALVAFDLKKDPRVILKAYNDSEGITREFNLNLLKRINRELDGTFVVEKFEHFPHYDPVSGVCYSYLISLEDQKVVVAGEEIAFTRNEPVRTEIAKKYTLEEIEGMVSENGFQVLQHLTDDTESYSLTLMRPV